MSHFTLLLIIANIALVSILLYALQLLSKQYWRSQYGISEKKLVRIGIYTIVDKKISSQFVAPFVRYIKKYTSLNVEFLAPETNDHSHSLALEYFIENNVDLILCVGNTSTEYIIQFLHMREVKIPVVVCGLISEIIPKDYFTNIRKHLSITGTITPYGWDSKIAIVNNILHVKKLAVIYGLNPNTLATNALKEKNFLNAALRKNNIHVTMININNSNISTLFDDTMWKNTDVILLMRDKPIIENLQTISKYFEKLRIPLILSDKEPVRGHGFIFIGSIIEEKIGYNCAKQALKVLEQNINANNIPIQELEIDPTIQIRLSYLDNEKTAQILSTLSQQKTIGAVKVLLN